MQVDYRRYELNEILVLIVNIYGYGMITILNTYFINTSVDDFTAMTTMFQNFLMVKRLEK